MVGRMVVPMASRHRFGIEHALLL
ncbi:MAG: hypothetical protein H6R09_1261, partial [Proteobacteria bacterium]|nr:hypothetical protein [Pseudomonadota bacterium]